jgi:phage terminase large subunit-like protein
MSAPSKLLETLAASGKIRHGGNATLAWQASNVQIKTDDAGNIKPTKKHSHSIGRIDGIVALVMALGIASSEIHGPQAEPEIMVI